MKIIFDADILSAFAKVEKLNLLLKLFSGFEPAITSAIHKELLVPINYGYTFPLAIFRKFPTICLQDKERDDFDNRVLRNPYLGKGELEAITICISRAYPFVAIDERALTYAEKNACKAVAALFRPLVKTHELSVILLSILAEEKFTQRDPADRKAC